MNKNKRVPLTFFFMVITASVTQATEICTNGNTIINNSLEFIANGVTQEDISNMIVARQAFGYDLMTTPYAHGVIESNSKYRFNTAAAKTLTKVHNGLIGSDAIKTDSLVAQTAPSPLNPKETQISGNWRSSNEVAITTGGNLFGDFGIFESPVDQISLQTVNASEGVYDDLLEKFGAKRVKPDDVIHFQSSEYLLHMEYAFDPAYVENYVLDPEKGGGLFVETHNFPHIFYPTNSTTSTSVLLGRRIGTNTNNYSFINVTLDYGDGIVIGPNVIHGDSLTVGNLGITLKGGTADSVLLRNSDDLNKLTRIKLEPN